MLWQQSEYNITVMQGQTQLMPVFNVDSELQPLVYREAYLVTVHAFGVFGFVASIVGICTNVINIITFIAMGVEDGVTTLFLGMAWSDLTFTILTAICNIGVILYIPDKRQTIWLNIDPLAVVFFSDNASLVMQVTTALTSTFLAIARCMCVVRPLHFKDMFTRIRSLIALVACFLFPLACQTAVFANMGVRERFYQSKNASRLALWLSADRERVKDGVRLVLNSIIPLGTQIIVVVCAAVMIAKLRAGAHFRNRQAQEDVDRGPHASKLTGKDRQVAIQVILISIIYMVTNIPKICSLIYTIVEPRFDAGKAFNNLYEISHTAQNFFEAINASVNFFVYYTFSSSFRSACFITKTKPV